MLPINLRGSLYLLEFCCNVSITFKPVKINLVKTPLQVIMFLLTVSSSVPWRALMLQANFKRAFLNYLQDFLPRVFTHSATFSAGAFLILSEGVSRTTFW